MYGPMWARDRRPRRRGRKRAREEGTSFREDTLAPNPVDRAACRAKAAEVDAADTTPSEPSGPAAGAADTRPAWQDADKATSAAHTQIRADKVAIGRAQRPRPVVEDEQRTT